MKLARFYRPHLGAWAGFDQLTNLRDEINRLFESPFGNGDSDVLNTWAPAIDLYEDNDNLVVRLEIPGINKEDLDISLHENTVTISGERKVEKKHEDSQTSRQERFFGRFTRSLVLPKQVDTARVKAGYKDGILTVTLPKAEDAKPKQINIQ